MYYHIIYMETCQEFVSTLVLKLSNAVRDLNSMNTIPSPIQINAIDFYIQELTWLENLY